ncbi:MAG TPA: FAD-binding protein, partial [Candidatus Limnocylindrales bacterium]|nr:FAD-binding protein [Candidatus Limnocylindrales bacterium]
VAGDQSPRGKTAPASPIAVKSLPGPASVEPRTHVLDPNVECATVRLDSARTVVGVGSGVPADALSLAEELARLLGGAVAATRRPVEAGLVDGDRKVGQTGLSITPRLYVGLGVSGAAQHLVGIAGARRVVAINLDPGAPLMRRADLAVTADVGQLLPLLIGALRDG